MHALASIILYLKPVFVLLTSKFRLKTLPELIYVAVSNVASQPAVVIHDNPDAAQIDLDGVGDSFAELYRSGCGFDRCR